MRRMRMSRGYETTERRPAPTGDSAAAAMRSAARCGRARRPPDENAPDTGGTAPSGGAPPESRARCVDRVDPRLKRRPAVEAATTRPLWSSGLL